MNTKSKGMSAPDIGNLLGRISEKRESGELPKTERQHVTPVSPEKQENVTPDIPQNDKTISRKHVNTRTRGNKKTFTPAPDKTLPQVKSSAIKVTGRPTLKSAEVSYVRLGVQVPKHVKQQMRDALNYERFSTGDGQLIKTLDELVTMALEKLLNE